MVQLSLFFTNFNLGHGVNTSHSLLFLTISLQTLQISLLQNHRFTFQFYIILATSNTVRDTRTQHFCL